MSEHSHPCLSRSMFCSAVLAGQVLYALFVAGCGGTDPAPAAADPAPAAANPAPAALNPAPAAPNPAPVAPNPAVDKPPEVAVPDPVVKPVQKPKVTNRVRIEARISQMQEFRIFRHFWGQTWFSVFTTDNSKTICKQTESE